MVKLRVLLATTAVSVGMLGAAAGATEGGTDDFLQLSLEELTNIEVTSVSKKSEKAFEAPAAIHVITDEDIKRSGVTSIAEALRLAPGLQVARAGSHQWAISSRGFNDQFSNKLLVLIDGRSVYTPLFSGVWWDAQDTLLEDIDRIEVIRGPGATLWGANAVNGVINIITKKSSETVGNYASVVAGNFLKNQTQFRHGGGTENGDTHYRVFGVYKKYDEVETATAGGADDEWDMFQGGFRVDTSLDANKALMVEGGVYQGNEDSRLALPDLTTLTTSVLDDQKMQGGHVLGRWTTQRESGDEYQLQGYFDYAMRDDIFLEQKIYALDLDFQHSLGEHKGHELIWGTGYRLVSDELDGTYLLSYDPDSRSDNLFSAFFQDKITLIPDKVYFTAGSKFEHNDYTGFEYQPSARLAWHVDPEKFFWASVARAIRTPNRTSDDTKFAVSAAPSPLGTGFALLVGDRTAESEELIAYEAGFRIRPAQNLSFDIATFYNDYDSLFTNVPGAPFIDSGFGLPPHPVLPAGPGNAGEGEALGFEIATNYIATENWDLGASYSYLEMSLSGGSSLVTSEGKSPQHQFNVQSHYMFTDDIGWDVSLYYVDELPAIGVDKYFRLDTQVAWEVAENIELQLTGQNLLDDRHQEISPFFYNSPKEIGRSVYGKVSWKF